MGPCWPNSCDVSLRNQMLYGLIIVSKYGGHPFEWVSTCGCKAVQHSGFHLFSQFLKCFLGMVQIIIF